MTSKALDSLHREFLFSLKIDANTGFCEFPPPGEVKFPNPFVDPEEEATSDVKFTINGDELNPTNGKEYWMPDRLCKICYSCEEAFTMYRRRHHCRMCGQVFCNTCSSYYIDGAWINLAGPQRACKLCAEQLNERIEREAKQRRRGFSVVVSPTTFEENIDPQRNAIYFSNNSNSILEKPAITTFHTNALQELASKHLERIVEKMLDFLEDSQRDLWKGIVLNLVREVVSTVDPDVRQGDTMDILKYVKVKIIPGGSVEENLYVDGIVLRKNVSNKLMTSRGVINKPRVLLLAGGIEFQRHETKFSSLDTLIEQETKYIEILVEKILSLQPDVVVVGKAISRRAQELLAEQRVVALQNLKPQQLERMSRMLGAKILPSTDHMIQQNGDECLGLCESLSFRQIQDDPERAEKIPGYFLQTRICRGSSYVYFEGCPGILGCSLILRGASRNFLREIKRVIKFSISVAYHLRLEVSYFNDRFVCIPTVIDPSVVNDEDSDTEEWNENVGTIVTSGIKDFYQHKESHRTEFNSRVERLNLSTSLEVDFCLPYVQPIRGVHLLDSREEPSAHALARDYIALSGVVVLVPLAGDRAQKAHVEKAYYNCYGQSDKTLGQFLIDNCFRLHPEKDKNVFFGHRWNFVHRAGRVEIEIMTKDSERAPVEEEEMMLNSGSVPIFTSSYCNTCGNWVTPLEVISDETWKLSFGKFLEIFLYNKSAICRTGECSHSVRDNHSQSFFCDTHEGRFQARIQYHPLHPYSLHIRKIMGFNSKFHHSENVSYLKHFLKDAMDCLGDFRRIIAVLEKEVTENVGILGAESVKFLMGEIGGLTQEVTSEQAEIVTSVQEVISFLSGPSSIDGSNEVADLELPLMYPAIFYKNFLTKATDWNRIIDTCHSYLSELSKNHVHGTLQHIPTDHPDTHKTEITDSILEPSIITNYSSQSTTDISVNIHSDVEAVLQEEEEVIESRARRQSVSGRKDSIATRTIGRVARALSTFGFMNSGDSTTKFSVPLDDFSTYRYSLEPGRDGKVVAVNEHNIASMISYSLLSKEYWSKLRDETEVNDDDYDAKNEDIREAEQIPDMEVPRNVKAQDFNRPSYVAEADVSILNPHLDLSEQHTTIATVIGVAKVVLKPEEPIKVCNIEEKDGPYSSGMNHYINQMRSQKKIHIRHQFEDKNEDGLLTCKFIVQTFWALQFHALRTCFLGDETDEGYIRSLSQSASWNAQGGKSGSTFSKSQDGRFVVKCISNTEFQMFIGFCPEYFRYLSESYSMKRPTVLCKILGVHSVGFHNKLTGKREMEHVVVMENVFYERNVTRTFDLKGSSRARYTQTEQTEDFDSLLRRRREARHAKSQGLPSQATRRHTKDEVLMDDNLMELTKGLPFPLKHLANLYLQTAIENDTEFLSLINVVDYSIIVGIDEDNFEVIVGIIDYMRQYDMIKRVERIGKSVGMIAGQAEPTIVQPSQYKKRFRLAMERNFMSVPDKYDM